MAWKEAEQIEGEDFGVDYEHSIHMFSTNIVIPANTGLSYTAPKNGYVWVSARIGSGAIVEVLINGHPLGWNYTRSSATVVDNAPIHVIASAVPVRKGDIIKLRNYANNNYGWTQDSHFYYAMGEWE